MGLIKRDIYLIVIFIIGFFNVISKVGAEQHWPAGERLDNAHAQAIANSLVWPDGAGLPPGRGSVAEGRELYARRCIACHGSDGRGGLGGELAGGNPDLTADLPDQNVGTYWPYATTLYDFIRRAMPMDAPRILSDDDVYALCAYLLFLNGIVGENVVLDAKSLQQVKMPNQNGFDGIEARWPTAAEP